ncbi:hypothetical protein BpHYR1_029668 [Brachionus plicatilis]|uniref:Uncharacterized protein n=1 Tax=Brachionus plicatilis TaxID=10195 RepID=A0A3M7QX44_BRAPC|nr:hypothetical protein BpHYR1_029668 [Brachionus plicatilis]
MATHAQNSSTARPLHPDRVQPGLNDHGIKIQTNVWNGLVLTWCRKVGRAEALTSHAPLRLLTTTATTATRLVDLMHFFEKKFWTIVS